VRPVAGANIPSVEYFENPGHGRVNAWCGLLLKTRKIEFRGETRGAIPCGKTLNSGLNEHEIKLKRASSHSCVSPMETMRYTGVGGAKTAKTGDSSLTNGGGSTILNKDYLGFIVTIREEIASGHW